jgi:trehalose 6-phosphate phosphatase
VPPADLLAPFRADPRGSALLLDVDGTLSPIVPHPDLSEVPAPTLALLGRLVARFGLVGCVSGRAAADVLRLVGVPGIAVSGNHGLEIADGGAVLTAPDVEPYLPALAELARRLTPIAARADAWIEDKGATLAVHFRQARDPDAAEQALRQEALPLAAGSGLAARFGRMVLEVRPPVPLDKGTAVRRLLHGRGLARSMFAGDDTTDLDAFAVVDVAVAVLSPESPPGLAAAAGMQVQGPAGLAELLETLA